MSPQESSKSLKPRPSVRHRWLYALPELAMPERISCAGRDFEHVETFKHDFFAATALYRDDHGLAVLKLGRLNRLFGLPLEWTGRLLGGREARLYALVDELPGVPRLIGRVGKTGLMHDFVPGHPLRRDESVDDAFFDRLAALLTAIHARHMAYVDLNKRQNILIGDDGRPYLIDFQISLHAPPTSWGRFAPARWLLRRFQNADWYHVYKHKRRLRPDLLTANERAIVERLSIWIRLHRAVARPLTQLRRWLLRHLKHSDASEVAGSSAK